MFSFAVWDERTKKLTIVRDRFGIKPLYWRLDDTKLEIGSEIKQVLPPKPKFNLARVLDYLESGLSDFSEETLFDQVFQVEPGCLIEFSISDSVLFNKVEWFGRNKTTEVTETFEDLFEESIDKHFRSDVEIGSCLSGGLDSAAIVAAASARSEPGQFKTFTAVFPGSSVDESRKAALVSEFCGTNHFEVQVDPFAMLNQLEKLTWHHDEPTGSSSMFAQWRVFEEAASCDVKVMLDGQGADEILGGYHSTFQYLAAEQENTLNFEKIKMETFKRVLKIKQNMMGTANSTKFTSGDSWLNANLLHLDQSRKSAWNTALESKGFSEPSSVKDFCKVMTYAVSLPTLLHSEDRNAMAHSIEARVPFLHPDLVSYALNLNSAERLSSVLTKLPIRKYLTGRVPSEIYSEPKKLGFATPEQEWFRGILSQKVEFLFMEVVNEFPEFFNRARVMQLFQDRMKGQVGWDFTIWRILSFGAWIRVFNIQN
jgi:asparagine synthase (glutamine-hydrolysing)